MFSKSIRKSLVLSLGFGMICVSVIMTIVISKTVLEQNKSQITKSIMTLTEKKADIVEMNMKENVYSAEALAGMLGGTWAIPEETRCSAAEQSLRSMVKKSTISSAWAYWLPEMFDLKDSEKADAEDNPTGQFKIHYIKDRNGRIKNDIISEMTVEEIERFSQSKKTFISDPKETVIDGIKVLSAKVFSPVINSIDQNIGIAGNDIVLSNLDSIVEGSSIYDGTVCQFITSSGVIMVSSDGSKSGEVSYLFKDEKLKKYFQIDDNDESVNTNTESFYVGKGAERQFVVIAKTLVDRT